MSEPYIDMCIKREFLPSILSNRQTLEVRTPSGYISQVKVGSILVWNADFTCARKVVAIRRYISFKEMLDNENVAQIMPGVSKAEIYRILCEIYSYEKGRRGVIVWEMEPHKLETE